jgi:large subunit ribosomal protein L18
MMLNKKEQRLRRARQTRIRIAQQGVARLSVNRTNLHIYASVVSEDGTKVLASASLQKSKCVRARRRWQGWQRGRRHDRQAHC